MLKCQLFLTQTKQCKAQHDCHVCAEIRSRWETTVQYILAVFRKCHSWKKLQNYNPLDSLKRRYKKKRRKETASRSFLYSASCYEKNRYIPYFSKTTQRNDAHGSKMSDESKVDQLRRNCSAQIKQPQKGKIKSNNLHLLPHREGRWLLYPLPLNQPSC